MNEYHHYEVGVSRRDGQRVALVRLRIGDAEDVVAERDVAGSDHELAVEASTDAYGFRYGSEELASAATRYLATEVAGGFTGVYVGPYALGDGPAGVTPARVDRFAYEPRVNRPTV